MHLPPARAAHDPKADRAGRRNGTIDEGVPLARLMPDPGS